MDRCIRHENKFIIHSYARLWRPAHQEYTSQDSPTIRTTLFLQTVKNIYFSSTSPVLVLFTPEKRYKYFGFTRLFYLNMKIHFKTIRRKRLRVPSRTNLRRYMVHHPRLPTLPSRKQISLWQPAQEVCTSQGARTYPYFSKPFKYIFQSYQSLLVLSTPGKHYKFFGFTRLI